jgi:predicted acetyltransferase
VIDVLRVPANDVRLGRLLQLYMHEWSDKVPIPLGADALYVYPHLDRFAGEAHECVLFFADTRLVGLALAFGDDRGTWHVEEMFVVAGERSRGVGAAAFAALTALRPGRWTLTVRPENPRALAFWTRLLPVAPVPELGADGVTRSRFTFDAR